MSVEKAKKLIFEEITPEIFLLEQSISIFQNIGIEATRLNTSKYRELFGIMQQQALSSMILSLGKLFEKPGKQYPNNSIPTALEYLSSDIRNISIGVSNANKLDELIKSEKEENTTSILYQDELKHKIIELFKDKCPRYPGRRGHRLDQAYNAVRALRDKRVAHSEEYSAALAINDWHIDELVAFSKTFVNYIGFGLLGFSMNGVVKASDLDFKNMPSGVQLKTIIGEII